MEVLAQINEANRIAAQSGPDSDRCPKPDAVPGTCTRVSTPPALPSGDRTKWNYLHLVSVDASAWVKSGKENDRKNKVSFKLAAPKAKGKNLS